MLRRYQSACTNLLHFIWVHLIFYLWQYLLICSLRFQPRAARHRCVIYGESLSKLSMTKPETRMKYRSVGSALALALFFAVSSRAEEAAKLPIPKSAPQAKAEHFVREHYKADLALRDPADQLALSRKLRDEINQFADDQPLRFVMLRDARELAVNAGDLDAAFSAIDDMDRLFAIDARELKASAMTALIDKSTVPPPQLIDKYLKLADAALSTGDVDMANKAYSLASMLADQQRDAALKQLVKEEHVAIMDAVREQKTVLTAMNKVKAHPEDAEANLLVGKYACFVRQLWGQGLPYLANGSDSTLKALAHQELAAHDADTTAAAADAWWDYAAAAKGQPADRARLHAAELYRQVMPKLSGAAKNRAEQRAEAISHVGRGSEFTAGTVVHSEK